MPKGLLIHNPKAGQQGPDLLPVLHSSLGDVEAVTFEDLGGAGNVVPRAQAAGCSWVAAAGGDGTIEAVASALLGSGIPLGIIPVGTFNNFALSLGLPLDPAEACAVIRAGRPRPVDVGIANGKPFFECVGAGMDAALYPLGEEIKSGKFHRWVDFFRKAFRYRRQRFVLTLDRPVNQAITGGAVNESRHLARHLARKTGREIQLQALMLTVSNGPYFGMNFAVAPQQRMDDGLLTVTVFSRYSKLELWWHFLSIAFGRHEYCPKSIAFRVAGVKVSGPRPLPVHRDGTPDQALWPLDIACHPGALSVFQRP